MGLKHLYRGCELESYTCNSKNIIGKEGNGEPPHKVHVHRKIAELLSLVSATLEIEYATQFHFTFTYIAINMYPVKNEMIANLDIRLIAMVS